MCRPPGREGGGLDQGGGIEAGIVAPTLQMSKLRLREVTWPDRGHAAFKLQVQNCGGKFFIVAKYI